MANRSRGVTPRQQRGGLLERDPAVSMAQVQHREMFVAARHERPIVTEGDGSPLAVGVPTNPQPANVIVKAQHGTTLDTLALTKRSDRRLQSAPW